MTTFKVEVESDYIGMGDSYRPTSSQSHIPLPGKFMNVSALCLLDLTAAFDTVDHGLMMLRLERQFGIRGVVLDWFRSYLCSRT